MIWKNKYKKRRKPSFFKKIKFLNFKAKIHNYSRMLLWIFTVLFFYSIVRYNFLDLSKDNDSREWNRKQIKELNLEELYKLKDLNHNDIRIWVFNHTNQNGLAVKISDCLLKGYYIGDVHTKGDYNILKQGNFPGDWKNSKKTEIFVHVDTINNPKFKSHLNLNLT